MKLINVGHVSGFHGLKGEMKVKSTTDFSDERFSPKNTLTLTNGTEQVEVTIRSRRVHKGFDLIALEGYDNLNDVEKFKGYSFKVSEEELYELEEDEFYNFELVGLEIIDVDGISRGFVKTVMNLNANDMFVVTYEDKEILIPFVKAIVDKVDLENKKITLFEIDGLW